MSVATHSPSISIARASELSALQARRGNSTLGPVPSARRDADLPAPGKVESEGGRPFSGRAGKHYSGGWSAREVPSSARGVSQSGVTRCYPGATREAEVIACRAVTSGGCADWLETICGSFARAASGRQLAIERFLRRFPSSADRNQTQSSSSGGRSLLIRFSSIRCEHLDP